MPSPSRLLTLVLRHEPEKIGIQLDAAGWTDVPLLLRAMKRQGQAISLAELEAIVGEDNKSRFTLSDDKKRIRAAQGHSVPVDLGLSPQLPPPVLYHGTARHYLDPIFVEGLVPGGRQLVHLSSDVETATRVGGRHGKAVVLSVDCEAMVTEGHEFLVADNGVWLTASVPAKFLGFVPISE
ncbi:RNA--NAD 2'-phosphotransferase [Sulfitobacter alexandrii]|uniref:Probable RNA 2'-phosphotransferase n=1 Tax=Sulfitobacter alexandrii TaxID=1917485 RepID=A0A1J0WG02_9RHOB|nr:RNA 2'-phosphotransferase [Sulfitobacter alexandrii]APE43242.1 RNA--NAD 2'-phosphotransferase [Sulfitobacter alexandrii]